MTLPPPLSLEQAQARLLEMAEPLGTEIVPIAEASSRHLAAPLFARRTQPPAELSAMDGYAMRADDLAGPWQIIGESAAGHPFPGPFSGPSSGLTRDIAPGEAVRISTGAIMPAGSGAVLLQENASREGNRLERAGGDPAPRHIRRIGFDFREGAQLLGAGVRLAPAQIALAVSGGHSTLEVARRPNIALLDSGDELAPDPVHCGPHQIPASNGAMLAAMVAPHVASATRIGPVPDRMEAVLAALDRAGEANVLVTTGGASVGDHDLVRPALEKWGARLDFWRVAVKPGKPLLVARRGRQWIIGLPGNPVSSYVTAFLYLLPLLRRIGGAAEPLPAILRLPLAGSLPAGGSRFELIRARVENGAVTPVSEQDSSALAALSSSTALIRRPVDAPPVASGGLVDIHWLAHGGYA